MLSKKQGIAIMSVGSFLFFVGCGSSSSSGSLSSVTMIAAGSNSSCAVVSDAAKCWGNNANGQIGVVTSDTCQLGRGDISCSKTPKTNTVLSGTVTAVQTGSTSACAIVENAAYCWGANDHGQLGDASTANSTSAVQVSGLSSGVTSISVGRTHACAVVSGSAKCWGTDTYGELGDGANSESHVPVQVSGLSSGVSSVYAGNSVSCALLSSGALKCWGQGGQGQLGNGATSDSNIPVQVTGLTLGVSAVAVSNSLTYSHVCAVVSGSAKCWGYNFYGEVGDGSTTNRSLPTLVSGLSSGVTAIATGYSHSCAVVNEGVKCWGNNYDGELGATTTDSVSSIPVSKTPVSVSELNSGVTKVSAGASHSCALLSSGNVKCWGGNAYGELGNNSTAAGTTPTLVSG